MIITRINLYRNINTRKNTSARNTRAIQASLPQDSARKVYANTPIFQANFYQEAASWNALAKENSGKVKEVLDDILLDIAGESYSRIKDITSSADKLKSKGYLDDLLGYTILLDNPNQKPIHEIMKRFISKEKQGELKVKTIKNYFDPKAKPYVSFDYMEKLKEAFPKSRVLDEDFNNGYNTVIVKFLVGNIPVELQIRGKQVEKIQKVEHLIYDIKQNKTVLKYDEATNSALKKVIKAYKSLSPSQVKKYEQYIKNYYIYSRALECDFKLTKKPIFPKNLNKILSMEHLEQFTLIK